MKRILFLTSGLLFVANLSSQILPDTVNVVDDATTSERIVIHERDARIGKIAGEIEAMHIIVSNIKEDMAGPTSVITPIYSQVYGPNFDLTDADGDEYYVWGIGNKIATNFMIHGWRA